MDTTLDINELINFDFTVEDASGNILSPSNDKAMDVDDNMSLLLDGDIFTDQGITSKDLVEKMASMHSPEELGSALLIAMRGSLASYFEIDASNIVLAFISTDDKILFKFSQNLMDIDPPLRG